MTNMDHCGRDLTGLPEWVRADYFQAHKEHGCLFADTPATPLPARRLDTIVSVRFTADEFRSLAARAEIHHLTVSAMLRRAAQDIPYYSISYVQHTRTA